MKYDHFEAAHFYGDPQPSGPRDTFFIPLVKKFNKNKKLKTPVENVAFSRTFFIIWEYTNMFQKLSDTSGKGDLAFVTARDDL